MSRSIHTTRKDLARERQFAANDGVAPTDGMTQLERDDLQKHIYKLNAVRNRQVQSQAALVHAQLALGESGLVRDIRLSPPK